jgi:acetyl-CoA carboxylase biotin carboxylase subunit
MIEKILIANRGEIAVRVIRTAREMGIRTVAVFSEADRDSMHVSLADEAVFIGSSEPSESYLSVSKILDAARTTGAGAIHPGYGFLSERASFSQACRDAGLVFIGPPPEAMLRLGSKIEAKLLAVSAGVPITPGYFEPGADINDLRREADRIGYPIMLKASAGGGGRGMRAVLTPDDFVSAFALATDEALKSFGDGAMMVEKLVEKPRHIEVQFIADQHGNIACLFERECSIQRRHQKLIEEAPSPVLLSNESLWSGLKESVTSLVKEAGYFGAGTAEFIYDQTTHSFYFLEVNARLQVEHPVTEEITGLDLVRLQIEVANGNPLDLTSNLAHGNREAISGHAIEVRIIAEDPSKNFMPSIGKLLAWAEPKGPGIRVDTGFSKGSEISRFYDSMLAKVIVHGANRSEAISRMSSALMDFHVLGIKTNIGFILDVLAHSDMQRGAFDTGFLQREFSEWSMNDSAPPELFEIVGSALSGGASEQRVDDMQAGSWGQSDGFRIHKYTQNGSLGT